jgi:hypothetical protein
MAKKKTTAERLERVEIPRLAPTVRYEHAEIPELRPSTIIVSVDTFDSKKGGK